METAKKVKSNWKVEKDKLQKEISLIKKTMSDYKLNRKQDWKQFKTQFKTDLNKVEDSLKKIAE